MLQSRQAWKTVVFFKSTSGVIGSNSPQPSEDLKNIIKAALWPFCGVVPTRTDAKKIHWEPNSSEPRGMKKKNDICLAWWARLRSCGSWGVPRGSQVVLLDTQLQVCRNGVGETFGDWRTLSNYMDTKSNDSEHPYPDYRLFKLQHCRETLFYVVIRTVKFSLGMRPPKHKHSSLLWNYKNHHHPLSSLQPAKNPHLCARLRTFQ